MKQRNDGFLAGTALGTVLAAALVLAGCGGGGMRVWWAAACLGLLAAAGASAGDGGRVVVGSKAFTEGYVMGEIGAQAIESATHQKVDRKLGMGSTGILFAALKSGVWSRWGSIRACALQSPLFSNAPVLARPRKAPAGKTSQLPT